MKAIFFSIILVVQFTTIIFAQTAIHPTILNTQSLFLLSNQNFKNDTANLCKLPKYKQGFFCNFEDQLNRKNIPIDFNLGNSKY